MRVSHAFSKLYTINIYNALSSNINILYYNSNNNKNMRKIRYKHTIKLQTNT